MPDRSRPFPRDQVILLATALAERPRGRRVDFWGITAEAGPGTVFVGPHAGSVRAGAVVVGTASGVEQVEQDMVGIDVDLLTSSQWPLLKAVRLSALQESPGAFMSHYEREVGWSRRQWMSAVERAVWVVAFSGRRAVGLACSTREAEHPRWRHLESVWVHPSFRRRGVTRELIKALIEREAGAGVRELWVWVIDGNDSARRAYERLGFEATGERQPLPGASGQMEVHLRLTLPRWGSISSRQSP